MTPASQESGIRIVEVRVRNFRSLKQVDVNLDQITILIGENNSGKTSFLEALHAAIGLGRRNSLVEDIYLAPGEYKVPKERAVTIDILIRPVNAKGNIIDAFPADSFWLALWGNGISQDAQDNDFVAIRTQTKWDEVRREYVTERRFLQGWQLDPSKWEESQVKDIAGSVLFSHIEPLALYLIDAKRDIQEEMYNKNSFWNRLVSDLGLTDDKVERFENSLGELNKEITNSSEVLQHVQTHLNELYQTISCEQDSVFINPIPRHLRNLSKGADINFATRGAQTFPLARHGMGTRSLAVLLTFRAYMTWRKRDVQDGTVHPMLGLEEPEAHLHPQAQRALFEQIEQIPGQRIVSTHSPYIASQAPISTFRHFRKNGADTIVTQLDTSLLIEEDLRKIDRMVMNTRGDLLYARAVILFEGETEEQALPEFAQKYWELSPNALGISLIGVGGYGNYLPFLTLVSNFGIPWYIFSDAEELAIKRVESALQKIGISDYSQHSNILFMSDRNNFESYLVKEGYGDVIQTMLDTCNEKTAYLREYMKDKHGQNLTKKIIRDYKSEGGDIRAMIDILSGDKTKYALPLAQAITNLTDEKRRFPGKIRQLFEQISDDIGLQKR
ncbi:ATP-dependent nuclease [Coleofasciculus sp. E1-EBD-02]|uniref:ATP-dependent nuclease n=1 Tax=Coleofasciculus sp. E1-EBD-02 TaxID=3068481 RepID=UPI0032F85458